MQAGTYSFIVKAENTYGYDRKELTITVNPAAAPNIHTVSFDSDGGSAVASQPVPDGSAAVKPADPTRKGYTFDGWLLNGKTFDFNTAVKSDITLTARWKKDAGTEQKVDVRGFSDADSPQALKGAGFGTVAAIKSALLQATVSKGGASYSSNHALYEVKLMVSFDDGVTWVAATTENFPSGGITVTLPYPAGTGKNTHNFSVAHMFTVAMRGHLPGGIEIPAVKKTDAGIQVTLDGLSPVLVSWTEITKPSNPSNPSGPAPPTTPTAPSQPTNPVSPSTSGTSDTNNGTPVAIRTGATAAGTAAEQQERSVRGSQTGDDEYGRPGIRTLVFLAALLLLISCIRKDVTRYRER